MLAASLIPSAARAADPGGVLTGRVFDIETRAPLAGAEVVVTSPALQTAQIVQSDASGFYRVPGLRGNGTKDHMDEETGMPVLDPRRPSSPRSRPPARTPAAPGERGPDQSLSRMASSISWRSGRSRSKPGGSSMATG